MNKYLWYSRGTCVTGRALAKALNFRHWGIRLPPRNTDLIVCWGARLPSGYNTEYLKNIKFINSVYDIEKNGNKFKALQIIGENCRVPLAREKYDIYDALDNKEITFPLLGRKYYHQGGAHSYLCIQKSDIRKHYYNSDYFLEYIPTKSEYRVHIFKGRVIKVQKKVESKSDEITTDYVRSRGNGWRLRNVNDIEGFSNRIKNEAIRAVNALGLDFGAADIVVSDFGKSYVLEINTGVGLDDSGIELYRNHINREIKRIEEENNTEELVNIKVYPRW